MKLEKFEHTLIDGISIHKIIDYETINYLKKSILNIFGIVKGNDSFPGAQPVSLELKDLSIIKGDNKSDNKDGNNCDSNNCDNKGEYLAGAKLDGERFFMYACQIPKDLNCKNINDVHNVTLLVDRTFSFYVIRQGWIHINGYKKNILLDGELVRINNKTNYFVHDVMIVEGNNVMDKDFKSRIGLFERFMKGGRWKSTEKINTFPISLKKFYDISELQQLIDSNLFKSYSDGIVFYPINEPIQKRTQFTLFKWKPPGHHTIDFKIHFSVDEQYHLVNCVELITWDPKLQKEFVYTKIYNTCEEFPDNSIIEFDVQLNELDEIVFYPLKQRIDKSQGNSKFTIERTIHNVRENITLETLIEQLT